MTYYNENNLYAAQWLRNLIAGGAISKGDVDERSIDDVQPSDLQGYTRCHFFAGIGGWDLALQWAGWPGERPVWTGSCPCQPFSSAGKRQGATDERHLWPAFQQLIAQRRPATIFGEQVASNLGREWMSAVRYDLESLGYACGAADLPAASVGSPHIRQRLWWVADAQSNEQRCPTERGMEPEPWNSGKDGGVGNAEGDDEQRPREPGPGDGRQGKAGGSGAESGMGNTSNSEHVKRSEYSLRGSSQSEVRQSSSRCGMDGRRMGQDLSKLDGGEGVRRGSDGHWQDVEYLPCADGKARPTKPGIYPLADGVPETMEQLRAYGNAIVPQVAAAFITAYIGTE